MLTLNERINNAAKRLSIDPNDIVSVKDLSVVRRIGAIHRDHKCYFGMDRCLMINYKKFVYHMHYCFVSDNGFVVEYEENELKHNIPNRDNIYNIMVLYACGFTQSNIARVLNVSVYTVRNRIKIIKQILTVASIYDIDPEDAIKIKYCDKLQLSDLSNRLQKIIDKYERRENDENVDND